MVRRDLPGVGAVITLTPGEWVVAVDLVMECYVTACESLPEGAALVSPADFRAAVLAAHHFPVRVCGGIDFTPVLEHFGVLDAASLLLLERGWEQVAVNAFVADLSRSDPELFARKAFEAADEVEGFSPMLAEENREAGREAVRRARPHRWN